MADLAHIFEMSIDPTLPASWEQDPSKDTVFAWLRPMNEFARSAFHLVVDKMVQNPGTQLSERKFIHLDGRATFSPQSASESEEPAHQEVKDQSQWLGAFKFSTAMYPKDPAKGWFIGTGRGKPEVDILIGPQDSSWINNRIRANHARLYVHMDSCRPIIEAFHSLQVSGATGLKFISPKTGLSSKVLEHGHQVQFGRCTYLFLRGNAVDSGMFETSLPDFMKIHHGQLWQAHPILSVTSMGSHHTIDQFTFFPGAFAQGSFGEVTAGWAQDGSVVAIKRFKYPDQSRLDQHQNIMGLIGRHENILELLLCSGDLETYIPAIYCIYSPLAMSTLEDVIPSYTMNVSAQIALLVQYLRGLAYLHDAKGIMHRDIKPCNLGVLSLNPPRGIILDLDSATTEDTSRDCGHGSLAYQAPDIIGLRFSGSNGRSYGRSVDVWALGMSAFFVLRSEHAKWNDFDYGPSRGNCLLGTDATQFVTWSRLGNFHQFIQEKVTPFVPYLEYFRFLKKMTLFDPQARISASDALIIAEGLKAAQGAMLVVPL